MRHMTRAPTQLANAYAPDRNGGAPVRHWLRGLDVADAATIMADIAAAEVGWPLGLPVCRALGAGVFEIRTGLPRRRTARVRFTVADGCMELRDGAIGPTRKPRRRRRRP